MSVSPSPVSSASVRNILTLLASRDAELVAGAEGLERRVTWACRMRTRLPAFESIHGGELALLTLSQLRRIGEPLPRLIKSLHSEGVAAIAVAAPSLEILDPEAATAADQLRLPLILLPASASLELIEREVITFVVSFRGDMERKATEISRQLMQLSVQGAGIQGIIEHLALICQKWAVVADAGHIIRYQAAPPATEPLALPTTLSDTAFSQRGLAHITAPILIRHEVVGYLALVAQENKADYLERIILGQVVPILALEFAREKERSEVESRYQLEAFMDVLQGTYRQPEEMLIRARVLGYNLTLPQVVVIFEVSPTEPAYAPGSPQAQWGRRLRDELLLAWPEGWIVAETSRVVALLPINVASTSEEEQNIQNRLERVRARMQQHEQRPPFSGGLGRIAKSLPEIPQAYREAQQALEIGRQLFGGEKLHSFASLGIYRLLFHLDGNNELKQFYQETLGPLLNADTRGDGALIDTLEGFFRYNGNLSEAARAMHLHRNSLLYRLGRIEEIVGHSLEDPEFRLALQIALKIHHLQQTTH